jgi:hypothetical protein
MINLTEQEAKRANCPICSASLKGLSETTRNTVGLEPEFVSPYASPAETAPAEQMPRVSSGRGYRRPTSSGGKSTWWIWVVVLLAVKGGIFALREFNRPRPPAPTYTAPEFNWDEFDSNPVLEEVEVDESPTEALIPPYVDENGSFVEPRESDAPSEATR